ncbi:MAG: Nif3-like dinuclear metal center hexameric protein [Candidatus Micrarchaeota archaeon]
MDLAKVTNWLDNEFAFFKGEDYSFNGLQFEGKKDVRRVAFAVDACIPAFEKASKGKADLLLVHHGLFWSNRLPTAITGLWAKRLKYLSACDLSLYAAHLPLDSHPKYGNNIELAKILGLHNPQPFAEYHGSLIALRGDLARSSSLDDLSKAVAKALSIETRVFDYGKTSGIKKVGVCTGGGGFAALDGGIDCLVTGEVKQGNVVDFRDAGVSVIEAGHYATEALGVKALSKAMQKELGLDVFFVDAPTGV